MESISTLSEKLSAIQVAFKSKKSRYNNFGKYHYRSAEDILEALKPFNEMYSVYFIISERLINTDGVIILESTATITDGKDKISTTSLVGVDLEQKGMQMPQRFGSASSFGKKYALGNLLLIDDTADADAVNTHGKNSEPEAEKLNQLITLYELKKDHIKDTDKSKAADVNARISKIIESKEIAAYDKTIAHLSKL